MGSFEGATAPHAVQWDVTRLSAPTSLYISPDDSLAILSWGITSGINIEVAARILTPAGDVVPMVWLITPSTNRVFTETDVQLREGFLLSLRVRPSGGNIQRGQCYVQLWFTRGPIGIARPEGMPICQGYVTSNSSLCWPQPTVEDSVSGRGNMRTITGTNPAVGVEIIEAVPTGALWRPVAFYYVLVTSAVVANRLSTLIIDDGATAVFVGEPAAVQAAGSSVGYNWAANLPARAALGTNSSAPFPHGLLLRAGSRIRTGTAALDAGDNYGAPQYLVEEWMQQ